MECVSSQHIPLIEGNLTNSTTMATINLNFGGSINNVNIYIDDEIQPIGFTESEDLSEEDITLRNFIEDLDYKIRHDKDFSKRFFAEVKGA
jgi:hypothetical protein